MKYIKDIKRYFEAHLLGYPYWRVEYKTGEKTFLLFYSEARGLADTFNGRLFIDYNAE